MIEETGVKAPKVVDIWWEYENEVFNLMVVNEFISTVTLEEWIVKVSTGAMP
jgi:hypothetical protein